MQATMNLDSSKKARVQGLDRRSFLRFSMALAGAAFTSPLLVQTAKAVTTGALPPDPLEGSENVEIRYTVCLMCHSKCGLRVKVHNNVIVKIDGNPYHPNNMEDAYERIPESTAPKDAEAFIGRICAKPQAYTETIYSPYRIKGPLKRVGKRGEGNWQAISWDQALDEIAAKLRTYRSTDPIDPKFPELGPKSNQVLFAPGRYQHGQKEFTDRWFGKCFGTINFRHDHTSICEQSHHIAGYLTTGWTRNHFKPDIAKAEFLLWFGANPLEANFPFQTLARKITDFKARGGKMAVVDPRYSMTAAKADKWLPAKPGTDAAVAMAMARWMVDNGKYDVNFLTNPSKAAANKANETCWTDATYLVNLNTGGFLRPAEIGIPGAASDFVVMAGGSPTLHSAVDKAELLVNTSISGIPVKSSFQLVTERLRERSIDEYAAIAGLDPNDIIWTAQQFAAAGKKAVANPYRGACQNTNGTYAVLAVYALNLMAGNFDWAGGNARGGSQFNENTGGGKPGSLDVMAVPNGLTPKGIRLTRFGHSYEKDAPNLFARDGYPAKRPWYPHGTLGIYQEVMPSIFDQYPYPLKALFTYWNAWPYAAPAQREVFERTVVDEEKLPLFVAFDIEMGQVSQYADYLLPDTTVLERWATPHNTPTVLTSASGYRKPVVGSFDGKPWSAPFDINAKNDYRGVLPNVWVIEDIFIALGKRLGLPGIGDNAFADGSSLHNAWDWYRKLLQNIAADSGRSQQDILAKGGAFEGPEKAYGSNGKLGKVHGGLLTFYQERLALSTDSMTGKRLDPMFRYSPTRDVMDNIVDDSNEYPFRVITYKDSFHAMARTGMNPTLMAIKPTNFVEMNAGDGRRLGLETGDTVRVVAPNGSIEKNAMVKLSEGIRPGVVAVAHSYGLWALSSSPFRVDGRRSAFDPTRGNGIAINPIMRVDPVLGNVTLTDKIGGSASFQDTHVRIEKIRA